MKRINQAMGFHQGETGEALTWTDLGRALGWAQTVTNQVKHARRPLRVAELRKVGDLLKVSGGWLAFGEGEPKTQAATRYADLEEAPEEEIQPDAPRKRGRGA